MDIISGGNTMKLKNLFVLLVMICFISTTLSFAEQEKTDPVNWRKLVPFLKDIKGWEAIDKAEGSTVTTQQFKMSEVEREYKSGDKTLEIKIIDGANFPMAYAGFKAMKNFQIDTSEKLVKSIKIKEYPAVEEIEFNRKEARLLILIGDRFLVQMEENNVKNADELKKIAEILELKKLENLKN